MIDINANKIRVRVQVSDDDYDTFTHINNNEDFSEWSEEDIVNFVNSKLSEATISEDDL